METRGWNDCSSKIMGLTYVKKLPHRFLSGNFFRTLAFGAHPYRMIGTARGAAPVLARRVRASAFESGRKIMFRWAIIFAVVALVAALLGFGGIAGLSADFAKILLVIGVVLFIVAFVFGRGRRTLP